MPLLEQPHLTPNGLSSAEADERLRRDGPNVITAGREGPSALTVFLDQFKSPLIYILLLAVGVTTYLQHWVDTGVIAAAVLVNTLIGFFQEFRAQRSIAALSQMLSPKALVLRDGKQVEVGAEEVVVGDIVFLQSGMGVPVDGVVLEAKDLWVDEAALTGESVVVEKVEESVAFMGTSVVGGRGKVAVTATGGKTEFGKIAGIMREMKEGKTPLQRRLGKFSQTLSALIGGICLLLFLGGVLTGRAIEDMFVLVVALAVSAIPEGLVVSLTAILAVGMRRIFKRRALVRKLVSAETLGSTTVICADKTGTLTKGRMEVVRWQVTDQVLAARTAALCNNLIGPTETALWDKVRGLDSFDPQAMVEQFPRLDEIPFSSERKYMLVLTSHAVFAKGALEAILSWCKIGLKEKQDWERLAAEWGGEEGLRVLALAMKEVRGSGEGLPSVARSEAESVGGWRGKSGFRFLGLVGFSDPLRPEVRESLEQCRRAGIAVKVITGDYRLTAEKLMSNLGIDLRPEEIIEGHALRQMEDEELQKRISQIQLFARTTPTDKLRIVEALQEMGEIVAMTGDGVNDAPALKRADIGIVVGEATEVAKETADMVLLDSNFQTIVAAVEEGRGIFETLRKVLLYLLSDSFAEVILVGGSLLLGLPLPITAVQILWVNLIEDGLPGLALVFEPSEEGVMHDPPRDPEAPLLDTELKVLIFGIGLLTDVLLLGLAYLLEESGQSLAFVRTVVFAALTINSLFYVFSCRSLRRSVIEAGVWENKFLLGAVGIGFGMLLLGLYHPWFQVLLQTQSLAPRYWVLLVGLGLLELLLIEFGKHWFIENGKLKMEN